MSRVPRSLEHLKTGFASEAATAARYRAFGARAERNGQPNLAREWRRLAAEKDELAILQLEATGQVGRDQISVADALAEERYENDVLYPKMMRQAGDEVAEVFRRVVEAQDRHAEALARLRRELQAARGDIEARAGE